MYGIRQMTMEQLFIRLLYMRTGTKKKYMVILHTIDRADEKNSIKGGKRGWFFDLENSAVRVRGRADWEIHGTVRLEKREHCF